MHACWTLTETFAATVATISPVFGIYIMELGAAGWVPKCFRARRSVGRATGHGSLAQASLTRLVR